MTTSDVIYCFDRGCVLFAIHPEGASGPREIAEISEEALRDVFGARGDGESLAEACRTHMDSIAEAALLHWRGRPGAPVELGTADFTANAIGHPAECS